jgi:hypothetical protein
MTANHDPHIGTWTSADGRMQVRLDPDGQFHELRSDRAKTFGGTYRIDGCRIHFHDPSTGYRATGEFRDGVMHADGCEFRKA